MNKRLIFAASIVPGIALLLLWVGRHPDPSSNAALILHGNIDVRLVNLAFEVAGRIASLEVAEGARVVAGQPLARLDTRRLSLSRDAVRARVEAQRAELAKLIAGTRPEEIQKLRADLEAARIEATNTRRHAERSRELMERKLTSSQDHDDARTLAEAAEARASAARAALDLALAGARAEDIAAAKARLAALEIELASAEEDLTDTVLVAPAEAVIQSRILEPGDLASTQRPVYTLALTEPLWARVYLGEPDLGRVRQGQSAQVFSDSFPGKAYDGWVGYIAPSAEFTPKTVQTTDLRADLVYQARVFVCNPEDELRQGMPVSVRIALGTGPLAKPGCAAESAPPQVEAGKDEPSQ